MAAIQITKVEKRYNALRALDGVSLEIEQGEFFGLLGPNGAGKTTLISIIAGLNRADAGSVSIHGYDVVKDYRQARMRLGVVPQELVFDPFFSVRETLRASSALALMRDAGVRAALVTDGMDDGEFRRICGLASARGMQRELLARWEPELAVAEVMTLWEDVSVVHWDSVCSLTTRQLHEMFRGTGLSHVVVVDHAEEWQVHVKALLSRTALAQRLGH